MVGDIFDSESLIMDNLKGEKTLMVNIVQSDGSDFFAGISWVKNCSWCYND